ncbi:MAG: 2-amino-4-hydroxy-6-hydroxymethyldihydropteridine diphosphokinase [Sulfitobacter sp.]|nr:2-amino-4-hydroxy-6-hydroxymethyldihydropteridine diphosphokinase [Sulfitobacter sp.]
MPQGQDQKQTGRKPPKPPSDILIALGGNLASSVGSPAKTLRSALQLLTLRGAVIRALSAFYHTPAYPAGNGPDYVNAAARITADWSPEATLSELHAVEAEFGRERVQRWGQRTLDLDLIAFDELIHPDAETYARWRAISLAEQMAGTPDRLILPHPRMHERAFVLVPLAEVAPDWRHPVLDKTVSELCAALSVRDREAVRPLE